LGAVKHLRIFVLVLLSVLLPLRGAVAATMLCAGGAQTQSAATAAGHGHHRMQPDHGRHEHHAAPHGHANNPAPDTDSSTDAHASTCQFCASGGCVTPIAPPPFAVASPLLPSSVMFPALSAPAAAYFSGGQERPPRTI